jgi:hypothetical protein
LGSPSSDLQRNGKLRWRHWLQQLAWCEPFWVLAVGVLLLVPRSLPTLLQTYAGVWRPWLVAVLVLGWLIRWAAYRELTRRTPLDWPLFFIILWLPVNYWASADKNLAWEAVGYLVLGIATYFALLNWPPAQRRPQIIGWLLLSLGVGLALMTPLMSAVVSTKLFRIQEIERTLQQLAAQGPGTVNANVAAGALVLTLPLFAAMAIRPDWRSRRWLSVVWLMAVPVVVALILTQSRSAYLAATIGIAVVLLLRWPAALPAAACLACRRDCRRTPWPANDSGRAYAKQCTERVGQPIGAMESGAVRARRLPVHRHWHRHVQEHHSPAVSTFHDRA